MANNYGPQPRFNGRKYRQHGCDRQHMTIGTAPHVSLRLRPMCILLHDAHTRTYVFVFVCTGVEEGGGEGLCGECANQSLYVDWRVFLEGALCLYLCL